jgi:DNA-binding HxlR family transcriptional regulator
VNQNSEPGDKPRLPAPGEQLASDVDWERVAEVLAAVNGMWAVPILRTLASGVSRPGDLLRAINVECDGRLSSKVMFETLGRLTEDGLVRRVEVQGAVPRETHYWPTRDGHGLLNELSKLGTPDPASPSATGHADPVPPPGIDTSTPNTARVWNALIGGKDHFAADREALRAVLEEMPSLAEAARLVRRFQADAVRRLTELGWRQFLDIGTGLPVAGAVHEVAQRLAPESRVVHVDNDPQVLAHGRALLRSSPEGSTIVLEADIRQPGQILAHAAETLDLRQPVAVITMMILHFLPDADDPWGIVKRLMDGIPGSAALVIGHAGADIAPGPAQAAAEKYNERSPASLRLRSHNEVARFFSEAGLEMLKPGLVPLAQWWPAEDLPQDANGYVGIGWRPTRQGRTANCQ